MLALITKFNLAFNRHDIDAMMEMMTEDCVFENTYPPP
ncbi:MAG: nuclear transport factor 2 family protein, partial [Chloroflexi bacterium HGW-Chloroflexi-8]